MERARIQDAIAQLVLDCLALVSSDEAFLKSYRFKPRQRVATFSAGVMITRGTKYIFHDELHGDVPVAKRYFDMAGPIGIEPIRN